MKIIATNRYLVVEPIRNDATHKEGGILVPVGAGNHTPTGKVIDVGPKVEDVTEGDIVVLPKEGAVEIDIAGVPTIIVHEDQILAIVGDYQ